MTTHTLVQSKQSYSGGGDPVLTLDAAPLVGDILIAVIMNRGGFSYTTHGVSDSNGKDSASEGSWVEILGYDNEISDSNARHATTVHYRIADATDALGAPTFYCNGDAMNFAGMLILVYRPSSSYAYDFLAQSANGTGVAGNDLTTQTSSGNTASVSSTDTFVLSLAVGRKNGASGFDDVSDPGFGNATEDYTVINDGGSHTTAFAVAHRDNQGAGVFSDTYECNNGGIEGTVAVLVFDNADASGIIGSSSYTEENDTLESNTVVLIDANGTITESDDLLDSNTVILIDANAIFTESDDLLDSNTVILIDANASITEADDTLESLASNITTGTTSVTEENDILGISGGAGLSTPTELTVFSTTSKDFNATAQSYTTNNFTSSSDSLLILILGAKFNSADGNTAANISDTEGLTWTNRVAEEAPKLNGMTVQMWTAPVTTGATMNVTVSIDSGYMHQAIVAVYEVTGYNEETPVVQTWTYGNDGADVQEEGAFSSALPSPSGANNTLITVASYQTITQNDFITHGSDWTELEFQDVTNGQYIYHEIYYHEGSLANVEFDYIPNISTSFGSMFAAIEIAEGPLGSPGGIANVVVDGTLDDADVADTLNSSGNIVVDGTLDVTESADTLSSSTDVLNDANTTVTEADDTLVSSTEQISTGTLSVTEADDTLSSSVAIIIDASSSITEVSETLSSSVNVVIDSSVNATEAVDTISGTTAVVVDANSSVTEEDDTLIASTEQISTGILSVTEADDTVSSEITVIVDGSIDITEATETLSSTALVDIEGTLTVTETADTLDSSGTVVTNIVDGSSEYTEDNDSLASAGTVDIIASSEVTESDDTLFGSTASVILATATNSEDSETLEITASVLVQASTTYTEATETIDSSALIIVDSILTVTEDSDTVSSSVDVDISISSSITNANDSVSISVDVLVDASSTISEANDTLEVRQALPVNASFTDDNETLSGGIYTFSRVQVQGLTVKLSPIGNNVTQLEDINNYSTSVTATNIKSITTKLE